MHCCQTKIDSQPPIITDEFLLSNYNLILIMLLITKSSKYLLLFISLIFISGEAVVNATTFPRSRQTLISQDLKSSQTVTFADPVLEKAIREEDLIANIDKKLFSRYYINYQK